MKNVTVVTTEFTSLKNSDFVANITEKGQAVGTRPDVFPSPQPTIAELTGANSELAAKIAAAADGSKAARNERDLQRTIVNALAIRLRDYVQSVANQASTYAEQVAIVELAKYKVAKERTPVYVGQVQDVRLNFMGNEGEVEVRFKASKGSHSYIIQKTHTDPAQLTTVWDTVATITRVKYTLTGLQPLTKVWCRVIAVGAHGSATPSDPAMSIVG